MNRAILYLHLFLYRYCGLSFVSIYNHGVPCTLYSGCRFHWYNAQGRNSKIAVDSLMELNFEFSLLKLAPQSTGFSPIEHLLDVVESGDEPTERVSLFARHRFQEPMSRGNFTCWHLPPVRNISILCSKLTVTMKLILLLNEVG